MNKKFILVIFAIVFMTMAMFFFESCHKHNKKLVLINEKTNQIIKEFEFEKDNTFSVMFIHSVNKTPVKDFYTFDNDDNIIVYQTEYYSFGAGVESTLENDETITYGENGKMTISNINKKINPLIYIIGTVSDHILNINGEDISLTKLCNKNTHILFAIK